MVCPANAAFRLVHFLNTAILKTDNVPVRGRKNRTQLIKHFSELNLCSALRNNLDKNEFVTPTPVQAQTIPPLMEGRDVVATAQTGTGKTLAFSIPLVEALTAVPRTKTIKVLILSPTRELAIQIDAAFRQLADGMHIRTAVVVGGMSETNQLRDIQAGAEVVIATPGRLCDYLDRRLIDLSGTATVVLDEADRMLDMGFLPSLRIILDNLPEKRHTMLFSATMEQSVAGLVASYVHNCAYQRYPAERGLACHRALYPQQPRHHQLRSHHRRSAHVYPALEGGIPINSRRKLSHLRIRLPRRQSRRRERAQEWPRAGQSGNPSVVVRSTDACWELD